MWRRSLVLAAIIATLLSSTGAWATMFGHGGSPAAEADQASGGATIDTEMLDRTLREMVDELYKGVAASGAKGTQTQTVRLEGVGWETPDGHIGGTSALGAYLGERLGIALSEKSEILSPSETRGAKGFFGTIVRAIYKISKAGVRLTLRMIDGSSGGVVSEVTRELGYEIFPGVGASDTTPPQSGEAEALAALVDKSVGGRSSDFGLRVSTDRGTYGSYVEGEKLTVLVEAEKDCYVRVYHVAWEERTFTLLFPNKMEPEGFLSAGQVRRIPGPGMGYSFEVAKPYGVDAIIAVASAEPFEDQEKVSSRLSDEGETADTTSSGVDSVDTTNDYVEEKGVDEERFEEIVAKGLIIKEEPGSSGLGGVTDFRSQSLVPATQSPLGSSGKARATCYFVTIKKLL